MSTGFYQYTHAKAQLVTTLKRPAKRNSLTETTKNSQQVYDSRFPSLSKKRWIFLCIALDCPQYVVDSFAVSDNSKQRTSCVEKSLKHAGTVMKREI